jgi:lipoprotein-releasing system permease protein
MIGILKAIGSPNHTIQNTFLYHGAIITITGIFAGNILGLLICWLQQHYGIISLPEDAYFISKAVVKLNWIAVVFIDVITFIVCFLVLLVPSLIIRNIRPTRAISFK